MKFVIGGTYFANEGDEDCWYTEINTDDWTGIIEVRGWEEEDSIILAQEVVSALNSSKSQFRLKLKSPRMA